MKVKTESNIRKALHILKIIVVAFAVMLVALMLLLQNERVQTRISREAMTVLEKYFDAEISFEKIHLSPFNTLIVKDLLILDKNPYMPSLDTFFRADYVIARFSLDGLFKKEGLHFSQAKVRGGTFNLVVEGEDNNLTRIFRIKSNPDKKMDKDLFDIRKASIEDFRFTMKIFSDSVVKVPEGGIDWADMEVTDINLEARRLAFSKGIMSGVMEHACFREKSGYVCNSLTGSAKVGNGHTYVENMVLKDPWSDIHMESFTMSYDSVLDFKDFINKVRLDAVIEKSFVSWGSIGYFAPQVKYAKMDMDVISGEMHGIISDFDFNNMRLNTADGNIYGHFDGHCSGIPDIERMRFDVDMKKLDFNSRGIDTFVKGWAQGKMKTDLGRFAKGVGFTLKGEGHGLLNRLKIKAGISSAEGDLFADVYLNDVADTLRSIKIGGVVESFDLNLGKILDIDAIGKCSMRTGIKSDLDTESGPSLVIDSLIVDRLQFNDYDYNSIAAAGKLSSDEFDGRIICNEPNLNFMFQGVFALSPRTRNSLYKFYANVGYIDLQALNFDKRGISKASFRTSANFNSIKGQDILGSIDVYDVKLENDGGKYDIGNISISSHSSDDLSRLRFNSSFADGTFSGTGSVFKFVRDLINTTVKKEVPDLFTKPEYLWDGERYEAAFRLHDSRDLLAFFAPGLYIADGTGLNVNIGENGDFMTTMQSQRIAWHETYIKDVNCELNNREESLNGNIDFKTFNFNNFQFLNNSMMLFADNNHIGLGYTFDNEDNDENRGEFFATGDIKREDGILGFDIGIMPSSLIFKKSEWSIQPSGISIRGKDISFRDVELQNGEQSLRLNGGISAEKADTLGLEMERFDISIVNNLLSIPLGLEGAMTGKATLTSSEEGNKGILMNMLCDSTAMGGMPIGTLMLAVDWDRQFNKFNINALNDLNGKTTLDAEGSFTPSIKDLSARVDMNGLQIGYIQPVLAEIFSEFEGEASGTVYAEGPIDRLSIRGENTRIDKGLLRVAFTNVAYQVEGEVDVDEYGLYFRNMKARDRYRGTGRVNGKMSYDHFRDLGFDIHMNVNNIEGMNISEYEGEYFYGKLSATGDVSITGPMNAITLEVNATTTGTGELHIPIAGSATAGSANLLKFKERESVVEIDPYEEMIQRLRTKKTLENDLTVKINATATPEVEAYIEIDKASGNVLNGRGNGNIGLEIRPSRDIFDMKGDFNVTGGNYKFVALGLASRDFTIQDGGSVKFNGDIWDTTLDIDALYRTKASLSTLISDTTSVNTRKTVECGINISDKLSNPRLDFSINIPDIDPTIKSKVENALSTEDKVQKQFLSLILSNSFLPDEQSGIVNNSTMLYSNVSEMMANQLNNIFQKLNIPVDLGLNYQPNDKGNDIFDVAVSTQLFNNRVIVNGNIGNRQYSTGVATTDVVGDLDIEVKLNRPGSIRLNLFSHSADQYSNYLDNSQRNGVGITWQQEFNNVIDFFRNIFRSRKKKEAEIMQQEAASKPVKTIVVKKED